MSEDKPTYVICKKCGKVIYCSYREIEEEDKCKCDPYQ